MASKYSLTYSPQALPGSCRCCGSAIKMPMIDMGYSEEFYGAVYYCMDCINEIVGILGYVSPEAYNEAVEALTEKNVQVLNLETELLKFQTIETLLKDSGYEQSSSNVDSSGSNNLSNCNVLPDKLEQSEVTKSDVSNVGDGTQFTIDDVTDVFVESEKSVGQIELENVGTLSSDTNSGKATSTGKALSRPKILI